MTADRTQRRKEELRRLKRQRRRAALAAVVLLACGLGTGSFFLRGSSANTGGVEAAVYPAQRPLIDRMNPFALHRPKHVQLDQDPQKEQRAVERFIEAGYPIYCGGGRRREVALTFDDGPGPNTTLALRILADANAPATFFLVGRQIPNFSSEAQAEAHTYVVGDHTWSHPPLTKLPLSKVQQELSDARWAINHYAHVPVSLFRPPYGLHSPQIDDIARSLGMLPVLWSVDSLDYMTPDWHRVGQRVVQSIHPGSIVLMHESHPQTLAAVEFRILPALRRMRLTPVTVPQLLADDPPTLAQLQNGIAACRR